MFLIIYLFIFFDDTLRHHV